MSEEVCVGETEGAGQDVVVEQIDEVEVPGCGGLSD